MFTKCPLTKYIKAFLLLLCASCLIYTNLVHKHFTMVAVGVQVRDCRASLWTVSDRWVMSCCWAWCLMYSRVRTWSREKGQEASKAEFTWTMFAAVFEINATVIWTNSSKHLNNYGWSCSRNQLHVLEVCVNSLRCESHSIHVCGWGSTGWRPVGSACCSSGHREPAGHQTGQKLERLDAVCSAARGQEEHVNALLFTDSYMNAA